MSWLSSRSLGAAIFVATFAGALACTKTETSFVDEDVPSDEDQDGGGSSRPNPDSGLGILTFRPAESYSGFDGVHTFKVPLAVYDSSDDLKVTAADPSAAEVEPTKLANPERNDGTIDNGKYFLVTVKKAGKLTLQATSKNRTVEAVINVAQYGSAQWTAGEARYTTGPDSDNPPCTNCHVNGEAIDHSPAALATATDAQLGAVITSGVSTANFPIKIDGKPGHKWSVSPGDVDNLVVYLRALEPRGFK